MKSSSDTQNILIIGGGIAGLTIAYRLNQARKKHNLPIKVTLTEASPRLGGIIQTVQQDDLILEKGPDMFFTEKPWALDLIRELGIENELISTNKAQARSLIFTNGTFHPAPAGLHLFVPSQILSLLGTNLISFKSKLRALREYFMRPFESSEEESIKDFVIRHFGDEVYHTIAQPMIGGIYSGNPESLSMEACLPRFIALEKEYGSLCKAYRHKKDQALKAKAQGPRYELFMSLRKGMGYLTDTLSQNLQGSEVRLSTPVSQVRYNDGWEVTLGNTQEKYNSVCFTLPAHQLQKILSGGLDPVRDSLQEFHYESVAIQSAVYPKSAIGHSLNAFGYVVPAADKKKVFGCSFLSQKFDHRAPHEKVILRAFAGGAFQRDFLHKDPEQIQQTIREEVESALHITKPPIMEDLCFYSKAMPQYTLRHTQRVKHLRDVVSNYSGLWLAGNYMSGVGIPDVIFESNKTAEQIIAYCKKDHSSSVFTHDQVGHDN